MAGPKTPQFKGKKVSPMGTKGGGMRGPKLNSAELEEGSAASDLLKKRSTSEFSRNELGALMQVPPGGAEPHQIKTQSRQFNRLVSDMPEATAVSEAGSPKDSNSKSLMSSKTPRIDLND